MIYLTDIKWKKPSKTLPTSDSVECEVDYGSEKKMLEVLKEWLERKYDNKVVKFSWHF